MMRISVGVICFGLSLSSLNVSRADTIYLAVGDSSAFGETDRTRNPSNGDRGYVAPFADFLGSRLGTRPTVINTALNGETTLSYSTGSLSDRASLDGILLNSNYAPFAPNFPSQLEFVRSAIQTAATQGNSIDYVTLQLGANDLSNAAEAPGFLNLTPAEQVQVVSQTIQTAGNQYAGILGELRQSLPNAQIYVIGYHNPYGGSPNNPFFTLAAPAVEGLNATIEGVGSLFGATYVDFYNPVLGRENELTLANLFPQDLVNYVHLNDAGYRVVSAQLIATADPTVTNAVPGPSSAILLGLGTISLTLWLRKQREKSALVAVAA